MSCHSLAVHQGAAAPAHQAAALEQSAWRQAAEYHQEQLEWQLAQVSGLLWFGLQKGDPGWSAPGGRGDCGIGRVKALASDGPAPAS